MNEILLTRIVLTIVFGLFLRYVWTHPVSFSHYFKQKFPIDSKNYSDNRSASVSQSAQGNNNKQFSATGSNSPITNIETQNVYLRSPHEPEVNYVNLPYDASKSGLGLRGVRLEGKRNNILEKNCIEQIANCNPNVSKIEAAVPTAPEFKQVTFHLEPKQIVYADFNGRPMAQRRDYTFSYFISSRDFNAQIDVLSTISSNNGEQSLTFHFDESLHPNVIGPEKVKIKVTRLNVANYFPGVPEHLKGIIKLINVGNISTDVSIFMPAIEEGLFASSPTVCGLSRNAEFLSYSSKGNIPDTFDDGWTFLIVLSPDWSARNLTPGINPHLFSWTDKKGEDGIRIIADSKDSGRFKAIISANGETTPLISDVTPLAHEVYSIILRTKEGRASLVVNGNNFTREKQFKCPKISNLSEQFYIGCNPFNENDGFFGTIGMVAMFNKALSDSDIKNSELISDFNTKS